MGDWRKLYIGEHCDLYCSPNTSRMNKSKGMRGLGHVAHKGFWWGNLKQGDHLADLGVDGRVILK